MAAQIIIMLVQVGMTPPPSTAGILTPSNQLLLYCKNEMLDLMRTVIDKASQQVSLQLVEVSQADHFTYM